MTIFLQKNNLRFLLATLAGITLPFAFAPYGIFPLAFMAPAVLLALIVNQSPRASFWLGLCFGLGFFGVGIYWVYYSMHDIAQIPAIVSILMTAGFVALLALFPAFTTYLSNRFFNLHIKSLCLYGFPAIWVFSEWLRSFILSGFPWLFLGVSQIHSPLKGYAPLLSVYGVSFFILLTSGLLVYSFKIKKFMLNLSIILTVWGVGGLLANITWTTPIERPISVALVQGNIPQTLKWSPNHINLSLSRYQELTEPLWGKVNLIIWPEAAIPLPLQNIKSYISSLNEKALANHSTLLLGIPVQKENTNAYYNAVISLGENNEFYAKQQLVPFGEYTPFATLLNPIMQWINIPMSNMEPGNHQQPLLHVNKVSFLTAICYEIGFPELTYSDDATLGFLVTVTNDAWFGHSNAGAQHLELGQMRAIELGRPLVFVGNDGITALIKDDGTIEKKLPPYQIGVLTGTIQPTQGLTPWMVFGIKPFLLFLCILIIFAYRTNYYYSIRPELIIEK